MNSTNTDKIIEQIFQDFDELIAESLVLNFLEVRPFEESKFKYGYDKLKMKYLRK